MKRPPGKWAMDYEACVTCGTTAEPHFSKGKCERCYFQEYRPANRRRVRAAGRRWYLKAGGRAWAKLQREQRHYGGLRETTLKRDGYRCVRCQATRQLLVHHRDGNGRGKPKPNNTLDNLETVCRKCHMQIHRPELRAAYNSRRTPPATTGRKLEI